jgi:hypothetical protein
MPTRFIPSIQDTVCFQNVSTYQYVEGDIYGWSIDYERESLPTDSNVPIYFILDSMNHAAFSHWVYESSTWLPLYKQLQKTYPSMKLVFESPKQFKCLYLEYYGISVDSICFREQLETTNYCFFHTYTSLNDRQIPDIYYDNLEQYHSNFNGIQKEKDISILYLPRGNKENLQGPNNRVYNIQEDLKQVVRFYGGVVYETDTTTSLEDQISLVKRAKCILLDYGSNLWVNGLFAEKSHILCLNIGWTHHQQYPAMSALWYKIHEKNTLQQFFAYPSDEQASSAVRVVCFQLDHIVAEIQRYLQGLSVEPV